MNLLVYVITVLLSLQADLSAKTTEAEEIVTETIKTSEIATERVTEPITEVTTTEQEKKTERKTEKATEKVTERETEKETERQTAEWDGITLLYSEPYNITENHLTRSNGSIRFNGHRETWYSIHEPGQTVTARDIPGKHIADDGTIRDADGYVCVASSDLPFYTVVMTSVGPGKVYDCGCSSGTVDVYTNW